MYDHESFSQVSLPGSPALGIVWKIHRRLPGADVEAPDIALHVRLAGRRAAGKMRGADDHDVFRNDGRRVETDLAGLQIDRLVIGRLQIDDAVDAEAGDRHAGLGVERHHPVARRHVNNAFVIPAVGPVRQAAARELTRRRFPALAFVLAVHPQLLARFRVHGHDGAARSGGEVQDALRHQRRRLEVELRARTHVGGVEAPCDLQFAEVLGVNLIERRISRARQIAAVGEPFAVLCALARLPHGRNRRPEQQQSQWADTRNPPPPRLSCLHFLSSPPVLICNGAAKNGHHCI